MWGRMRGGRVASGAMCGTRRGMGRSRGAEGGGVKEQRGVPRADETGEAVGWASGLALMRTVGGA